MRRDDIRYYINEEKRTIVAVVDGCKYDAVETLLKADNGSVAPYLMNYEMPDTFRGRLNVILKMLGMKKLV